MGGGILLLFSDALGMDNSRAIIQKCLGEFGRFYNMVEILCPPTYSQSLIKTG